MKSVQKSLLLLCLFGGLIPSANAFEATVNIAPICEKDCQQIDVSQYGVLPNTGQNETVALNKLLSQYNHNVIFHFPAGIYNFDSTILKDGLSNVRFEGDPGAIWKKANAFQGEYLLISRFSNGLAFSGFEFRGLTHDKTNYNWGESGLYLGSSNGTLVEHNRFYDFGDAALRVTSSRQGRKGVSSSNAITRNNYFENVTQVTTTSNQNGYGGAMGYLFDSNELHNLKGSVKFATRTPGAGQIIVTNNKIFGVPTIPTSVGIEVVGYSNVFLENNLISDCGGFAINIYTNPGKAISGFDWGNYLIRGNTIENCLRGIRVSAQAFSNGYKPKVKDINILTNTIHVKRDKPIQIPTNTIQGLKIQDNIF